MIFFYLIHEEKYIMFQSNIMHGRAEFDLD
jgi:hypothetical protein